MSYKIIHDNSIDHTQVYLNNLTVHRELICKYKKIDGLATKYKHHTETDYTDTIRPLGD